MKCTAWCGRILVIGFAKGSFEKVAVNRVLLKNISLIGLHWYVVVFIKLGTIKACY
jgi:NADPH2:quinone reductase